MLSCCWLGGRMEGHPACKKIRVVGCWLGYLSGVRCRLHIVQLMPLLPTVSCFSKIQIYLPFCYQLSWVVLDRGLLNRCSSFAECCLVSIMLQSMIIIVGISVQTDGSCATLSCSASEVNTSSSVFTMSVWYFVLLELKSTTFILFLHILFVS